MYCKSSCNILVCNRSRSASPSFLPRRLGSGGNWEKHDLELHCAHLESEIDRLENDFELYKTQVDELNFKVEQVKVLNLVGK